MKEERLHRVFHLWISISLLSL